MTVHSQYHLGRKFNMVRTGTDQYPWNIYLEDGHGFGSWVGYGRTLKICRSMILSGVFDDEITS